ncbi:MAG TPA: hypothetical protein PK264_21170 [Hyphomicrobiaceae bacterium]|nr:hypothetical protein [Hyphomicrobiaceae bacterium]
MRGGSWNFPAIDARASIRQPLKPDYGVYSIGFRVARDLPN